MNRLIIIIPVIIFSMCDHYGYNEEYIPRSSIELNDLSDLGNISRQLDSHFNMNDILNSYQAGKLKNESDKDLANILSPLEEVGNEYVKTLLREENLSQELQTQLEELEGASLALAGFIYLVEMEMEQNENLKAKGWDASRVMSCLGTATGYSSIKAAIDVSGLMSANTLMSVCKAIGKRYLGYLGTAVLV